MSGISWVAASNGSVPANAVSAGRDKDGGQIYVGRARFSGDLLPAKVVPNHRTAFVSFNGGEHRIANYEVLVTTRLVCWPPASDGSVPAGALAVGKSQSGETLYMARVEHGGALTPGKVHPSHRVCYIPFDGKEHSFRQYNVLFVH